MGNGAAKRVSGKLAYRSEESKQALGETGILPVTEPSERRQVEIAISGLSRASSLGEPLATTLAGLATRIATYTYCFSTSTGRWAVPKAASRSCGHENPATLIL